MSIYTHEGEIFGAPPQESLVLTDTGSISSFTTNANSKSPIGLQYSIGMNASLSSGVQKYQYNRFFWNKEFFTFNYFNCGVGVVISCFNIGQRTKYTVVYPIFMPRTAVSLFQSDAADGKITPAKYKEIMQQFVYYLNFMWTSYGNAAKPQGAQTIGQVPAVLQYSTPAYTASDCKGNFTAPNWINDNPYMPIIAETVGNDVPPLIWDLGPNFELTLRINPDANINLIQSNVIYGIRLISLREYMFEATQVSIKPSPPSPITVAVGGVNVSANTLYTEPSGGWFGMGVHATGFGNFERSDRGGGSVSPYYDGFTDDERVAFFKTTNLPTFAPNTTSFADFVNYCKLYGLQTGFANSVIAKFNAGFIDSRFYTISSDSLTRNAQRSVLSNNPNVPKTTIGIEYNTLDNVRTWQDRTIGVQSNISSGGETPVSRMNPYHSIQSLDFNIFDEFGVFINSFNVCQYPKTAGGNTYELISPNVIGIISANTLQYSSYTIENEAWGGGPLPLAAIPAWLLALNPNPDATNGESIFLNSHWNANVFAWFFYNPSYAVGTVYLIPTGTDPATGLSTTVTHFGRLLGTY